ncbi:glycosyl transferase [Rheinheimera sp. NSM]|uniref:glycosyl transferase n=1 Tax=Rheinheimera sp. NSM TaxID=3457884 RepID=UPI004036E0A8
MIKPFYFAGCRGANFVFSYQPSAEHALLLLPPFGDEMNKSRHLLTRLMQQAADAGISSYLMDPYGTGDSMGDLDQTSVIDWRTDLRLLLQQLATLGYKKVSFVAVRFGAMLLLDLLQHSLPLPVAQLILWQPQLDTARFLQQLCRLKIAEQMSGGTKINQAQLEQQLADGQPLEIAGYPISPAFYHSVSQLHTTVAARTAKPPLYWFEVSAFAKPGPAVQQQVQALSAGFDVQLQLINSDPFWSTQELVDAAELLRCSLAILEPSHAD